MTSGRSADVAVRILQDNMRGAVAWSVPYRRHAVVVAQAGEPIRMMRLDATFWPERL